MTSTARIRSMLSDLLGEAALSREDASGRYALDALGANRGFHADEVPPPATLADAHRSPAGMLHSLISEAAITCTPPPVGILKVQIAIFKQPSQGGEWITAKTGVQVCTFTTECEVEVVKYFTASPGTYLAMAVGFCVECWPPVKIGLSSPVVIR